MAVTVIRRMDSIVVARFQSLGYDRSHRTTPIVRPDRFMTGCNIQRSCAACSQRDCGDGCLPPLWKGWPGHSNKEVEAGRS